MYIYISRDVNLYIYIYIYISATPMSSAQENFN